MPDRSITAWRVLAAACLVVFLAMLYSNYRLRQRIHLLEQSLGRAKRQASSRVVRPGETFESLRVLDHDGAPKLLDTRGRETGALVAVVNPQCASCDAVTGEVRDYVGTKSSRPVWLLSLAEGEVTRDFAARHGLQGVTYHLPDDVNPFLRQRLSSVPQVFVVDAQEKVIRTCETVAECATALEIR